MTTQERWQIKAIDHGANVFTKEANQIRPKEWYKQFYTEKVGVDPEMMEGVSVEKMIEKMDRAGIDITLLIAAKTGPLGPPQTYHLPYKMVADIVDKYPDRFRGLAGVDPTMGMKGVRELEYGVKNLGFVGAHLYPHWFGLAPDHAKYYPFYAKCVELDIPIEMQVGHCLVYSKDYPLRSVGRPITLDTIACDFPELKLIGIHIGYPWTEEMISVAWKHPNVYIGADAYAPKYWQPAFVHFINTWGQDKVLFGTDFPLIDFERMRNEVESLDLRIEAKRKFLRENALKVFKL
jgi:predicted TIM-barrel fold metal-dependent hydrolase